MKSSVYHRITQLLVEGKQGEAVTTLEANKATMSPQEYRECRGNAHFYRKEYQESIPHYEWAMQSSADYDCARYHYLLGVQAERNGQLTEAFKRFEAAVGIESEFVDTYIELGALLVKIGDLEGALGCYTDAVDLDPKDIGIKLNRAQILSQLARKDPDTYWAQFNEAKAAYEQALALKA